MNKQGYEILTVPCVTSMLFLIPFYFFFVIFGYNSKLTLKNKNKQKKSMASNDNKPRSMIGVSFVKSVQLKLVQNTVFKCHVGAINLL